MKNRKIYQIILFILILDFIAFLQEENSIFNDSEDNKNKKNEPLLSSNNLGGYAWSRKWGGSSYDYGRGIAVDSLNNIYIVGYRSKYGAPDNDILLVKYNSSGEQEWSKVWSAGDENRGHGVAVDSSNNAYIVGYTYNFEWDKSDSLLVKYNCSGELEWNKTWGGLKSASGYGVVIDSSDNVYITGYTKNLGAGNLDMFLIKYNSSGVQLWFRTWGGSNDDLGYCITVDSSENIYIAGTTQSFGAKNQDMCLVKFNNSGDLEWYKIWGGTYSDIARDIAVDSSDNIYIVGNKWSSAADSDFVSYSDMFLVKYDSAGEKYWNIIWGGSENDYGYGVVVDSSDNVYITGKTYSFAEYVDMYLLKYDGSGVQLWNHTWDESISDCGYGITMDSSENIYIVGTIFYSSETLKDMYLVKFDSTGPSGGGIISGYGLFLLISVVFAISIILIGKHHKFNTKLRTFKK